MSALLRAVDDDVGVSSEDEVVTIADRYELISRVGQGATGSVYRAHDRTLDRQVAIKLLKPGELNVGEREAQVLARVTHRNVVTIHDFGMSGGLRYLVLELLEGRDFCAWLRERPEGAVIVAHFVEAGRGLAAAHEAGLVHRDFKPSNVLLTDAGRVVVIDFGLARSLDSLGTELEPQHFTEGTLAYMAPERLAGHENDERSDQFSFCVAMWEALTGQNPFTGADPLTRFRSIRRGPDGRDRLQVARHIAAALERGMSFERSQRFSSMPELLRAIEQPASTGRSRKLRPVLTTLAIAATFAFGWGITPESPTIDVAQSSFTFDPRADTALSMLESARKRAADGDTRTALNDLMRARQLLSGVDPSTDDGYCDFGETIPEIAEVMADNGGVNEARMAYAIALRFSQDCPEVAAQMEANGGVNEARMAYAIALRFSEECPDMPRQDLLARRESARGITSITED